MNFLAHAYLSFEVPEIIIGNLIADMVRGKQILNYPEEIQKGIRIHRLIDDYTDKHPVNKETKRVFNESVGRYDSSFLDVAYDHFVATDIRNIPAGGWSTFADYCYTQIEKYGEILPEIFTSMYAYMHSENWLANYQNLWMIERSFERLTRRANYLSDEHNAYVDFNNKYDEIQAGYNLFFPDLKAYAQQLVSEI